MNIQKFGGKVIFLCLILILFGVSVVQADGWTIPGRVYFPIIFNSGGSAVLASKINIGAHASNGNQAKWLIDGAPVRIFIFWNKVEISPGIYDWSFLDNDIPKYEGHRLLVSVTNTPEWCRRDDLVHLPSAEPKLECYDDLTEFIVLLVDRYSQISDVEIGNEPDVDPSLLPVGCWWMGAWGWTYPDGVRYANLVNMVVPRIQDKVNVLVGALHFAKPEFLMGFLDAVTVSYDGLSYHAYDIYRSFYTTAEWDNKYRTIKALAPNDRLYVTETNLVTDPGVPTSDGLEQLQAKYVEHVYSYTDRIETIYLFVAYQCGTWRNDELVVCERYKPAWFTWHELYYGAN